MSALLSAPALTARAAPAATARSAFAGNARALACAQPRRTPLRCGLRRSGLSTAPRRSVTTMGLFGLGLPELVVIGGVVAVLFGPSKLPELGKTLGKTVKSFQGAAKARRLPIRAAPLVPRPAAYSRGNIASCTAARVNTAWRVAWGCASDARGRCAGGVRRLALPAAAWSARMPGNAAARSRCICAAAVRAALGTLLRRAAARPDARALWRAARGLRAFACAGARVLTRRPGARRSSSRS